ncbi:MAG: pilus assembly protein PilM, partial [Pseudomonadota bacterium]
MFFGNKSQPLLGLDITTSSVKLIELSQSGKRYRVESYSAEPTPPSSVNEKAIVDMTPCRKSCPNLRSNINN